MSTMNQNQAMAWAVALKRDKKIGDGVTDTNGVDGFEEILLFVLMQPTKKDEINMIGKSILFFILRSSLY